MVCPSGRARLNVTSGGRPSNSTSDRLNDTKVGNASNPYCSGSWYCRSPPVAWEGVEAVSDRCATRLVPGSQLTQAGGAALGLSAHAAGVLHFWVPKSSGYVAST